MEINIVTKRHCEAIDITAQLQEACRHWGGTGALLAYCPHTTAGVAVNEHADPDVMRDLAEALARVVPHDGPYAHSEGNSDAHIKSVLAGNQVVVPVRDGHLLLGRWQGAFFLEFDGPRHRTLWLYFLHGE